MKRLYLIVVVGAEEGQAEYKGTEYHIEVVKGEKEADEDSANIWLMDKLDIVKILLII